MHDPRLSWQNVPASQLGSDAAMAIAWDRLNAASLDLPFLSSDVLINALSCFGQGTERLLVGRDGKEVHAMFVLERAATARWQTFQPSQLPLGAWVAQPAIPLPALTKAMLDGPLSTCLVLSVTQVDPRGIQRPHDEPCISTSDYIDTAWIEIGGSFDSYWMARGKNLRANMRKQRSKLAAEGVSSELKVLDQPGDLTEALKRYALLEGAGWKADKGTAIVPDNLQGRFYLQLLTTAAARGEAVVYEYLFNGRTVAMHLCLRRRAELVILKTTYDESLDKSLSPALLLHEDELRQFFATGQPNRLEYYGRVMEWHTRWTDARRTLYHLTHYRWAWLKTLKHLMAGAKTNVTTNIPTSPASTALGITLP